MKALIIMIWILLIGVHFVLAIFQVSAAIRFENLSEAHETILRECKR